jgi:HrpA-like RNA helicase
MESTSRTDLKITPHLYYISLMIEQNIVTQVVAPTGSGKSIGIPEHLAALSKTTFICVPTRVSAISLSTHLKYRNPGLAVGHAADGIVNYTKQTQVVFATAGHVRRKMFNVINNTPTRGFDFTDILILDETHSGSMDNTVIISLWMCLHQRGLPVPHIVLLSATPCPLPIVPAPVVYTVPVPSPYPVSVYYDPVPIETNIYQHAAEIVLDISSDNKYRGDILVFTPGANEADELLSYLEGHSDLIVLPAYSALEKEALDLIYNPAPVGITKVIVATNIAESSITIDGIVTVIDTMKCKEPVLSVSGGTRLETVRITKASAQQRKGRCGRTREGICIRLISEKEYEELDDHRKPEIERLPIYDTVMEFLGAGIHPSNTLVGVSPDKVASSLLVLNRLRLIECRPTSIIVTDAGAFVPTVPLDVYSATFLWRWVHAGYEIYPGVVMAGLISAYNTGYYNMPRKQRHMTPHEYDVMCSVHIERHFAKWRGPTQLHSYLNMWIDLAKNLGDNHQSLMLDPTRVNNKKWLRDNSVSGKQLWDAILIMSKVFFIVQKNVRISDINLFDVTDVIAKAHPILCDIHADTTLNKNNRNQYYHPQTKIPYMLNQRMVISDIDMGSNPYRQIVAILAHEIVTKENRHISFVDMSLPLFGQSSTSPVPSKYVEAVVSDTEELPSIITPKKPYVESQEQTSAPSQKITRKSTQKSGKKHVLFSPPTFDDDDDDTFE